MTSCRGDLILAIYSFGRRQNLVLLHGRLVSRYVLERSATCQRSCRRESPADPEVFFSFSRDYDSNIPSRFDSPRVLIPVSLPGHTARPTNKSRPSRCAETSARTSQDAREPATIQKTFKSRTDGSISLLSSTRDLESQDGRRGLGGFDVFGENSWAVLNEDRVLVEEVFSLKAKDDMRQLSKCRCRETDSASRTDSKKTPSL